MIAPHLLRLRGRADLVRALAYDDPTVTAAMVELLELKAIPEPVPEIAASAAEAPSPTDVEVAASVEASPTPEVASAYWRLETLEPVEPEALMATDLTLPPSTRTPTDPPWRGRLKATPALTPLASPRALLTRLRSTAATLRFTSEIDLDALVERLSRTGLLDVLPRRQQRAWGATLCIIIDRARRLVPYWQDQDRCVALLQALYPASGLTVAHLGDGEGYPRVHWPREQYGQPLRPVPGAPLLVLGDLGCLVADSDHWQRYWLQWGQSWRAQQHPLLALVPARRRDLTPALAQTWTVLPWEAETLTSAWQAVPADAALVRRLLTLLAPAVRLEPGLLRTVRTLLPEGRQHPGLEH